MDLASQIRRSGCFAQGNCVPLATPSERNIEHMRTRDHLIKVHLTEDEAANIKTYAELCGITKSALMRMLIRGRRPRPLPPIWFGRCCICRVKGRDAGWRFAEQIRNSKTLKVRRNTHNGMDYDRAIVHTSCPLWLLRLQGFSVERETVLNANPETR